MIIGVYEGEEKRIVSTEQIPLAELTPEFVRERVNQIALQQFAVSLDLQVVSEFIGQFLRLLMRDIADADGGAE